MSTQTDDTMELARTRRDKFNKVMKEAKVTKAAQITDEFQRELFAMCESFEERCALRQHLTIEYRMAIKSGDAPTDNNGILTEAMLGYESRLTEGALV